MKLIAEWRRWHTFYSVQLAILIAVLGCLQATILPMWQAQVPPFWYALANSGLALLLTFARLVKQGPAQEGTA